MRPKLFTPGKVILGLIGAVIAIAMFLWLQNDSKIPFINPIPSTAGKIAFVHEDKNTADIYMVDGVTGANIVAVTNDGKGADREPVWSANGEELALTSDRNGIVRQLYLMDAKPEATVVGRTNTSSTKEAPQYGPDNDVYYLDAGRITKLTPRSGDIDAVFPTADQMHKDIQIRKLFGSGGITRFAVSADGERIFAAVKQEDGEALVVYVPQEKKVGTFGVAEKVLFQFAADDTLIAVFINGQPLAQGRAIGGDQPADQTATLDESGQSQGLPPLAQTDVKSVVVIDKALNIKLFGNFTFSPSGLAVTSDAKMVALTSTDKKMPGVFFLNTSDSSKNGNVTKMAASEPAWSPDGSTLAFVSGDDIYTIGTTGGEPKKLTDSKGHNSAPIWSPAKAKK